MKTGTIIIGTLLQPTPTGGILQAARPIIMTAHGDLRGECTAAIAHGAGAAAGVSDFHGAGEALGVGAVAGIWAGATHLIGAALTHTGAVFTATDIRTDMAAGAMAADIGVVITTTSTEEAHPAEEGLIHTTEALPINMG